MRGTPGSACPQPEPNATELPSCAAISARAAQRRRRRRWWRREEGTRRPGPEGQVLHHVLRNALQNALRRALNVLAVASTFTLPSCAASFTCSPFTCQPALPLGLQHQQQISSVKATFFESKRAPCRSKEKRGGPSGKEASRSTKSCGALRSTQANRRCCRYLPCP